MKGYWKDLYGEQSQDFIRGVIAGVEAYAIWKDGKEVVGVLEEKLEDAIKRIKEELGYQESR